MIHKTEDCKIAGTIVEVGPGDGQRGETPLDAMRADMLAMYEEYKRDGTIVEVGPDDAPKPLRRGDTDTFEIGRTPSRRDSSPGPSPNLAELLADDDEAGSPTRKSEEVSTRRVPRNTRHADSFTLGYGSRAKGANKKDPWTPNDERRPVDVLLEPSAKRLTPKQVCPGKGAARTKCMLDKNSSTAGCSSNEEQHKHTTNLNRNSPPAPSTDTPTPLQKAKASPKARVATDSAGGGILGWLKSTYMRFYVPRKARS